MEDVEATYGHLAEANQARPSPCPAARPVEASSSHACCRKSRWLSDLQRTYALQLQVEELHGLLRPHLLRRLKADVLGSLPPKKEQIVRVELAAPQRALYKSLLTNSYQTLISGTCWRTAHSVAATADGAGHLPWVPCSDEHVERRCTTLWAETLWQLLMQAARSRLRRTTY